VYNAKFKKLPSDFKALSIEEINLFQKEPYASPYMPIQEKGIRPSCGLSYELYAEGLLNAENNSFNIRFEAGNDIFGQSALGSAFNVYAPGRYRQTGKEENVFTDLRTWAFAVKAADLVVGSWPLKEFENEIYFLRVYGPNGFFREYKGTSNDPGISLECHYQRSASGNTKATGNVDLLLTNLSKLPHELVITDNAYKASAVKKIIPASKANRAGLIVPMDLSKQYGWYDFTVRITGSKSFERRYAGRVETGSQGFSDPYMGRVV
jgi:phospholipase C